MKKIKLFILFIAFLNASNAQEIFLKTNVLSAIIGVPSLASELKIDTTNSFCLIVYGGSYEFLGANNVHGIYAMYRKYIKTTKRNVGVHINLGPNWQVNDLNSFFGITTILGYQHFFGRSNFVYDIGIGNSFPVQQSSSLYESSIIQPRINFSIGYKIVGKKNK